jgi:hypothetical protein
MKNYSVLKVAAFVAILLTAMAFSCQDHHVPDPDPVSNCNLVDGTPRALPCEFEISKIEFFEKQTDRVIETITPQQLQGNLSMSEASDIQPLSGHATFALTYRTKMYVKRIVNSPSAGWNKYKVMPLQPFNSPSRPDNIFFPSVLVNDVNSYQEIPSWPIGDTKIFETDILFLMSRHITQTSIIWDNAILYGFVLNYNTWEVLTAAPHSYSALRDISEAKLTYRVQMGP